MRKLIIKQFFTEVSDAEIAEFEAMNDIVFPEFFKAFIKDYNGSKVYENCFQGKYIISNFLPLKKNRNASIELIMPAIKSEEEGIGRDDLIPFAIDPGGRPYLFSVGKNDFGQVYIDRMSAGYQDPLLKIADSFEQFIQGLEREPS